jgi:hypothetical protein
MIDSTCGRPANPSASKYIRKPQNPPVWKSRIINVHKPPSCQSLWEPGVSPASRSHQRNMYQSKQALQAAWSWLEHYETVFSSHKVVGFPPDSSSLLRPANRAQDASVSSGRERLSRPRVVIPRRRHSLSRSNWASSFLVSVSGHDFTACGKTHFSEGYGLQAVRKGFAMNPALAAE